MQFMQKTPGVRPGAEFDSWRNWIIYRGNRISNVKISFPKHGSFWKFLAYGPEYLEAFDGELFRELVDKIIVESNERIRFRLINGLEPPEEIERTVR